MVTERKAALAFGFREDRAALFRASQKTCHGLITRVCGTTDASNDRYQQHDDEQTARCAVGFYVVIDNEYLAEGIKDSIRQVNEGTGLDEVIEQLRLFPRLLIKLFAVGVATGQMDKALLRAAAEMDREVDDKLARLTNVLEPMLIIILSVIVGIILISVVLPVVSIMNNIG